MVIQRTVETIVTGNRMVCLGSGICIFRDDPVEPLLEQGVDGLRADIPCVFCCIYILSQSSRKERSVTTCDTDCPYMGALDGAVGYGRHLCHFCLADDTS